MRKVLVLICVSLLFYGCEELEIINLPRDNPNDIHNPNYVPNQFPIIIFSRYEVVFDSNGDGIINKNESVKLRIFLKNIGNKDAKKVKATISCQNSYITNLSPTTEIPFNSRSLTADDYIPAQEERYGYSGSYPVDYTIAFDIPYGAYTGASPTFNINIKDDDSNEWTASFTITIY